MNARETMLAILCRRERRDTAAALLLTGSLTALTVGGLIVPGLEGGPAISAFFFGVFTALGAAAIGVAAGR